MTALSRQLYLCCYDIENNKARQKVRQIVGTFASGGQKSAYECFLSPAEKRQLQRLCEPHLAGNDCFVLQLISDCEPIAVLGRAQAAIQRDFIFFN